MQHPGFMTEVIRQQRWPQPHQLTQGRIIRQNMLQARIGGCRDARLGSEAHGLITGVIEPDPGNRHLELLHHPFDDRLRDGLRPARGHRDRIRLVGHCGIDRRHNGMGCLKLRNHPSTLTHSL